MPLQCLEEERILYTRHIFSINFVHISYDLFMDDAFCKIATRYVSMEGLKAWKKTKFTSLREWGVLQWMCLMFPTDFRMDSKLLSFQKKCNAKQWSVMWNGSY